MAPLSIYDSFVKQELIKWFGQSDELFVHVHCPHSGASSSDYFVSSMFNLNELMDSACLGAVFFILRERQFPVRDMVDDDLILAAMEALKDGEWYRIVQREFYPSQLLSFGSGETHEDLRRDLEQCRGMKVCVGPESVLPDEYWNWDMKPNDKIIIVVKPDQ